MTEEKKEFTMYNNNEGLISYVYISYSTIIIISHEGCLQTKRLHSPALTPALSCEINKKKIAMPYGKQAKDRNW